MSTIRHTVAVQGVVFLLAALTAYAFSLPDGGRVTPNAFPAWALYVNLIFTLDLSAGWLSIRGFVHEGAGYSGSFRLACRAGTTLLVAQSLLAALFIGAYFASHVFLSGDGEGQIELPFAAPVSGSSGTWRYMLEYYAMAAWTLVAVTGLAAAFAVNTHNLLLACCLYLVFWVVSAVLVYTPWRAVSLLHTQFYGIPEWLAGRLPLSPILVLALPTIYGFVGWGAVFLAVRSHRE